jgi:putative oxidoreductase
MERLPILLTRHSGKCYAVLRIIIGLLFACHGAQKLFGVLGGRIAVHSLTGLVAGLIELGGGILVALGFCVRTAAFIACGEMAVAYFMVCASRGFWPITNGGEMAVVYCFVFFYIFFQGSGLWSLDSLWNRNHESL